MTRRWLSILLLLYPLQATAAAEVPARVLILPFDNATGLPDLDGLASGAADLLTVCFSAHDATIEVVDRTALEPLLRERGMGWQGLLSDNPSRGSLQLSGARYVIRGTLRGTEGRLVVSAFLHDLASTQLIRAQEASGPASSLPDLLCSDVARELVRGIGVEESGHAALPADDTPWRSQLLILGIGHYYNGNYAEAFPAFLKLLRRDPKDGEAHFWLAQSFHKAGLSELAERQVNRFLASFPKDRNRPRAMLLLREIEAARQPQAH